MGLAVFGEVAVVTLELRMSALSIEDVAGVIEVKSLELGRFTRFW